MRTFEGRLPDLRSLSRRLEELRLGATLRGVEVTIRGWLVEQDDRLSLVVSQTGDVVRLAPLERMVRWDFDAGRAQVAIAAELTAYQRLRLGRRRQFHPVLVTGPLVESRDDPRLVVQVREFVWTR